MPRSEDVTEKKDTSRTLSTEIESMRGRIFAKPVDELSSSARQVVSVSRRRIWGKTSFDRTVHAYKEIGK